MNTQDANAINKAAGAKVSFWHDSDEPITARQVRSLG
jgi:hypothetical protein